MPPYIYHLRVMFREQPLLPSKTRDVRAAAHALETEIYIRQPSQTAAALALRQTADAGLLAPSAPQPQGRCCRAAGRRLWLAALWACSLARCRVISQTGSHELDLGGAVR
jgi:hypothetical protein